MSAPKLDGRLPAGSCIVKVLLGHVLHPLVPSGGAGEGLVARLHGARHPGWESASDAQGILLHLLDHEVRSCICAPVVCSALAND